MQEKDTGINHLNFYEKASSMGDGESSDLFKFIALRGKSGLHIFENVSLIFTIFKHYPPKFPYPP